MEQAFDGIDGVLSTRSGYIGGRTTNPTYETVSSGTTGHAEAVQVVYDPRKLDYESLLLTFWHNIDPTARDRQFCDFGSQYRSAIFYHDEAQQRLAQQSKTALETKRFDRPLETQIVPAGTFYPAEEYHQDYYLKTRCGTGSTATTAAGTPCCEDYGETHRSTEAMW